MTWSPCKTWSAKWVTSSTGITNPSSSKSLKHSSARFSTWHFRFLSSESCWPCQKKETWLLSFTAATSSLSTAFSATGNRTVPSSITRTAKSRVLLSWTISNRQFWVIKPWRHSKWITIWSSLYKDLRNISSWIPPGIIFNPKIKKTLSSTAIGLQMKLLKNTVRPLRINQNMLLFNLINPFLPSWLLLSSKDASKVTYLQAATKPHSPTKTYSSQCKST